MRYYKRLPDGTVALEKKEGRSPFMFMDGELLRGLDVRKDGTFSLLNEPFRIIQPQVLCGNNVGYDLAVVMKESVAARFLQWYYRHINRWMEKTFRLEKPLLVKLGRKPGEQLPWWSITGLLSRTMVVK